MKRYPVIIFALVLFFAETPHILDTLGVIDSSSIGPIGLAAHTVSMLIFSVFIAFRIYGFLRRR